MEESLEFSSLDPTTMPIHYALVLGGLVLTAFALTVSPVKILLSLASRPRSEVSLRLMTWLLLCGPILVIWTVDPGGFWDWFVD
jgi:hypothetical protein